MDKRTGTIITNNPTYQIDGMLDKYVYIIDNYIGDGILANWDGLYNVQLNTAHNSNTEIWADVSGNSYNGSLNGDVIWEKNGLKFNGENGYVNFGKIYTEYITMETVVEFNEYGESSKNMDWFGNPEHAGSYISLRSDGTILGAVNTNGVYTNCFSNEKIELNKKYYLALSYDGDTVKLYINGNLDSQVNEENKTSILESSTFMCIGGNPSGENSIGLTNFKPLNGTVYSARLYSKALTENEIINNYKIDNYRYL